MGQALTTFGFRGASGSPVPLGGTLWDFVFNNIPNFLATPFIYILGLRFGFAQGKLARNIGLHITVVTVYSGIDEMWRVMGSLLKISPVLGIPATPRVIAAYFGATWFEDLITVYLPILGVAHIVSYYRQLKQKEVTAAQLETSLQAARLEALKSQLHPHFLFNSLHAVAELMHTNLEAADEFLVRLGDMLRALLTHIDVQEVGLDEEIEHIRKYLAIEQVRLGERLTVAIDIDPATLSARVPYLLLQPIVENAVLHGVEKISSAGHICIGSALRDEFLILSVDDNGPGLSGSLGSSGLGVGLKNVRQRLEQLYGRSAELTVSNRQNSGVSVRISIPLCRAATGS